jgi:hypothetical protein
MAAEKEILKDILDQELAVDDFVAFPDSNTLKFGKITKLTPKMVRIVPLVKTTWRGSFIKRPTDVMKMNPNVMMVYILSN